ncbi:MAG: protein-disulfide isomerase/uncharacterized membrane protein, partial [Myxococcota bacterium]
MTGACWTLTLPIPVSITRLLEAVAPKPRDQQIACVGRVRTHVGGPMSQSAPTTSKQPLMAVPLLMAAGIGFAIYLITVKLGGLYQINYESACNLGGDFNCDAVQASSYSMVLGIPVAVWAIPTYAVMLFLSWLGMNNSASDGENNPQRAVQATNLLVLMSTVLVAYSVLLGCVQYFVVKAFCAYCFAMYVCQLGVLIAAVIATPNGFLAALKGGFSTATGGARILAPSAAVFGLVLAASLVWYHAEDKNTYHASAQQALADAKSMIINGDHEAAVQLCGEIEKLGGRYGTEAQQLVRKAIDAQFAADFAAQPPTPIAPSPAEVAAQPTVPTQPGTVAIAPTPPTQPAATPAPVRPPPSTVPAGGRTGGKKTDLGWSIFEMPVTDDDFVKGPMDAPLTIVEFADFECGYCRMLAQHLKTVREKPEWKDKVRFIFKFYPMDGACNPRMGGERMHPEACIAAKASYCAGKQGKFIEAHDKLFAMQKNNQADKVKGYMEQLGVDGAQFDACMNSQAPLNRIQNDIRLAAKAGIHGTPRMYINNRLVSGASSVSIIEYYLKKALEAGAKPAAPVAKVNVATAAPMAAAKKTAGQFFIDRYEASIDAQGRAVSLPNVRPAQVSWFEAKAACEKAGKRMCSEEEWSSACTGAAAVDNNKNSYYNDDEIEGQRYPYGAFYEADNCHDGQETLSGATVATGSKTSCRTPNGIFDLTGNIAEWIEPEQNRASQVGGNFGSGEGAACNRRGTSFGPGIRNNTTGFRCCSDTMVANTTANAAELQALPGDLIGKPVPKFSIKTADGKTVDENTWKGKVSYVTFFASWCGSCKRELPELSKWNTELGPKGFQVVAIGVDR